MKSPSNRKWCVLSAPQEYKPENERRAYNRIQIQRQLLGDQKTKHLLFFFSLSCSCVSIGSSKKSPNIKCTDKEEEGREQQSRFITFGDFKLFQPLLLSKDRLHDSVRVSTEKCNKRWLYGGRAASRIIQIKKKTNKAWQSDGLAVNSEETRMPRFACLTRRDASRAEFLPI